MPERAGPVPGTDTQAAEEESLALMPEARPQPQPSGEPEEGPELQAGAVGASPAAPEQTLAPAVPATPAAPAAPTALGPQEGTQASLSLKSLEEVSEVWGGPNDDEACAQWALAVRWAPR